MNRAHLVALVAVAVTALSQSACKRPNASGGGGGNSNAITLAGSTSVQPFAEKWAEAFSKKKPGAQINVQGGGSTAGVKAALQGAAQIGTVSRELKPDEKSGLKEIVVARDGIAIIVNVQNPVADMPLEQVRDMFTGRTKSWKTYGGVDKAITLVTREEGSGTRGAFEELALKGEKISSQALVQDSTGAVRMMVKSDPSAVGYISIGQLNESVRAMRIASVEATEANVVAGKYPLVRPFLFVTTSEATGLAKEFIDFVLSAEGQEIGRKEGLIPAK